MTKSLEIGKFKWKAINFIGNYTRHCQSVNQSNFEAISL